MLHFGGNATFNNSTTDKILNLSLNFNYSQQCKILKHKGHFVSFILDFFGLILPCYGYLSKIKILLHKIQKSDKSWRIFLFFLSLRANFGSWHVLRLYEAWFEVGRRVIHSWTWNSCHCTKLGMDWSFLSVKPSCSLQHQNMGSAYLAKSS